MSSCLDNDENVGTVPRRAQQRRQQRRITLPYMNKSQNQNMMSSTTITTRKNYRKGTNFREAPCKKKTQIKHK